MQSYESIIDLLNHEGPGLQDYVSVRELDQLIDGTLAPAKIANCYLADLADSTTVTVTTDLDETRADLLSWIRSEIEIAIQQREEDKRDAILAELTKVDDAANAKKMDLIAQARQENVTKAAIAKTLGISRPTLDKMLAEQEDRALFDRAAFELQRADISSAAKDTLGDIIAIRDTMKQARTVLAIAIASKPLDLSDDARTIIDAAVQCAMARATEREDPPAARP